MEEVVLRQYRALMGIAVVVLAGQAAAGAGSRRLVSPSGTYRIRRGDTLSAISLRLKVPVAALLQLNHIGNPHRIRAGDVLQVRAKPAGRAPAPGTATVAAAATTALPPLPTPI